MKKRILISALLCAAVMSGCSSAKNADSGGYSGSSAAYQYAPEAFSKTNGASLSDNNGFAASYDSYDYAEAADSYESPKEVSSENLMAESPENSLEASKLSREMLVYYCTMSIDTLNFNESVSSFKRDLEMYGGFIEQENYSDGGYSSGWYNANSEKWQSYTATLRVPSKNYDDFCNSASQLGDLRSKNARVENVSQEYSDLNTTLEIYEAKEARYIALLSTITEDEYAVAIEKELTDIQIQIATIRTRMNAIETDVAYSYVYITINEVKEYVSEPVKTDTFFDRLSVTLKNAGSGFLSFLEDLLFLIIYLAPYLVLIGIVVFIVASIVKSVKRRRAAKREKNIREQTEQTAAGSGDDSENSGDKL